MKKFRVYSDAVAVAVLQIIAFFPLGVLIATIVNVCEWRTYRVWSVLWFNIKAAAHTIKWQWNEIVSNN